jgi:uncharacterized membrane protein YfcA
MLSSRIVATLSGIISGTLGGLNGIAGSIVNIPILTSIFKLTQHQAHGTTAVAAFASSLIGSYSFYKFGGGYKAVDIPAAGAIGLVAMTVSPIGATLGQRLTQKSLLYILSGILISAPPLLVLKDKMASLPLHNIKREKYHSLVNGPIEDKIALSMMGVITGLTSGFFGVGGGIILVPLLSLYTSNHQVAVGMYLNYV